MSETKIFPSSDVQDILIEEMLKEVVASLEERGYNPINQIVGYIISGDPGYISNHKEARTKITKFEKNKVIEVIVKRYLKNS